MSESQLDDSIRAIVRGLADSPRARILAYHTRDSRRSAPGFPDWVFAGRRGVMFRENKTARGRVWPDQRQWLDLLDWAGADAAVWRPADLASGRISYELLRLAGLEPSKPAPGAYERGNR